MPGRKRFYSASDVQSPFNLFQNLKPATINNPLDSYKVISHIPLYIHRMKIGNWSQVFCISTQGIVNITSSRHLSLEQVFKHVEEGHDRYIPNTYRLIVVWIWRTAKVYCWYWPTNNQFTRLPTTERIVNFKLTNTRITHSARFLEFFPTIFPLNINIYWSCVPFRFLCAQVQHQFIISDCSLIYKIKS